MKTLGHFLDYVIKGVSKVGGEEKTDFETVGIGVATQCHVLHV